MSALTVGIGLLLGVLAGISGTGGAFIIPTLIYLFRTPQLKAQGTALLISALPIWIVAFVPYYRNDNYDFKAAMLLAIGVCVGSYFGGFWAQRLPIAALRRIFAAILMMVALQLWFTRAT